MPISTANNIKIYYETFGDASSTPLVLVGGLGWQWLNWEEEFCELLAENGFFVIALDNRDTGFSTKLSDLGEPDLPTIFTELVNNRQPKIPYTVEDMATDVISVLDSLDIKKAHMLGTSLGGMVVQAIAFNYPERVLSIIPIGSSTNNPSLPKGDPEALAIASSKRINDREAAAERAINLHKVAGSTAFPRSEDEIRETAYRLYDRAFDADGVQRQMAAALCFSDSREKLKQLTLKALVIHGTTDTLITKEHGLDIHHHIPDSELKLIEGMGHEIPKGAWNIIVDAIKGSGFLKST